MRPHRGVPVSYNHIYTYTHTHASLVTVLTNQIDRRIGFMSYHPRILSLTAFKHI